jgi:hypothetical protein
LFVFGEHAEQALDEEVGDAVSPQLSAIAPRWRMAARRAAANWPAASAVMAAVDFSGRSFSGSVNTQFEELALFRLDEFVDADFARLRPGSR